MATINRRDAVLLVIAFLAARAINAMMRLGQSTASATLRKLHHFERTDQGSKGDVVVMAERLRRQIDSRLITCADRNTYFLSPLDGGNLAGVQIRVLVSAEIHEISFC